MMKVVSAIVLAIALSTAVYGGSSLTARRPDRALALRLLDRATQLAQNFNPWERADALFAASEIAAELDANRANAWSHDAFNLARQMPLGQNRVAMEKNALRVLAINAPDTALALYRKQDVPSQWGKPDEMGEDSRALSNPSIFDVVWKAKGKAYLDRLESLADYLGKTGQYPYRPMGAIALDLAPTDLTASRRILKRATHFFGIDPGFWSTNDEFLAFMLDTRSLATPKILRAELRAAVKGLEHPRSHAGVRARFRISAVTPLGTESFNSKAEYLLFRLLPLAKIADPGLAAQIVARHPVLKRAPEIGVDTPVTAMGVMSLSGATSDQRMRSALDEHAVFRVSQLARREPQEGLRVAQQISDPILRTMALVLLAPSYRTIDSRQAESWLAAAKECLLSMPDNVRKLQLVTEVVKAYIQTNQTNAARSLLPGGLRLGEQLYESDAKQHHRQGAYDTEGFDQLIELASAVVWLEPPKVFEKRLNAVIDPVLRAQMLISAARAVAGMPGRPYMPA